MHHGKQHVPVQTFQKVAIKFKMRIYLLMNTKIIFSVSSFDIISLHHFRLNSFPRSEQQQMVVYPFQSCICSVNIVVYC